MKNKPRTALTKEQAKLFEKINELTDIEKAFLWNKQFEKESALGSTKKNFASELREAEHASII
jgi:hypothetical protein